MSDIIEQYLKLNLYSDLNRDFIENYQSHPNYPSLYAVTDTFTLLGIENVAAKIPKEQFTELPKYFLGIFNQDFVLVSKTEDGVFINIR